MPTNVIKGFSQINTGTVQRANIDISTPGKSLITKIISGSNLSMQYTGADAGTGDVTLGVATATIQDIAGALIANASHSPDFQPSYDSNSKQVDFIADYIPSDGWILYDVSPISFLLADSPTYILNTTANITGTIGEGMKFKLNHLNREKFFFVSNVAITGAISYLTLYGGTDYTLTTGAITNPHYSPSREPFGFPTDPDKWTVETTNNADQTQSSPTTNTWYNLGSLQITVPIGKWYVSYKVLARVSRAAATATNMASTLSNANNTESDPDMTTFVTLNGASGTLVMLVTQHALPKVFKQSSKTTYFLNGRTTAGADSIGHRGDVGTTIIRARTAYL